MITCQECGKPAMYQLSNGALICLECVDRFQLEQTAAIINFLLGEMVFATEISLERLKPRIETPKGASHRQPTMFTNIRVDRSVVGVINAGQAQAIDVALTYGKHNDNPGLCQMLQEFTQAVLDNRELDQALRKVIIEQLSFLISQTLAKPGQKRPSIVNTVLKGIKETLSTFAGLVALWETLEPYLREVLH